MSRRCEVWRDQGPAPSSGLESEVTADMDCPDSMSTGIVSELGKLGRGAIIDKDALARMFNRCPTSIDRAVDRGELPTPVRMFGKACWTAGAILDHIDARLKYETEKVAKERERLARYDP